MTLKIIALVKRNIIATKIYVQIDVAAWISEFQHEYHNLCGCRHIRRTI